MGEVLSGWLRWQRWAKQFRSGLNVLPLGFAGLAIGGAGAVVGLLEAAMRLGHGLLRGSGVAVNKNV
jgi:hypothetical protein